MEQNEITMAVDVKLDLKERRSEFRQFRHKWNKTVVRIEAIKCFPCYVKVTFIKSHDAASMSNTIRNINDTTNQVVNINMPGLSVGVATSRTKNHAYGLFWNNNRQPCCIYLAFDTQQNRDLHLKWLRNSIKNLELHRREILETRRASRFGVSRTTNESDSGQSLDISQCDSRNETSSMKDGHDQLRPLPDIPDASSNWSRRISGFSGIYEEIMEPSENGCGQTRNSIRRMSRASVASGIYEVMRPPLTAITESVPLTPPPLPPRQRTNTNQGSEFKRSYTNPETETFKKRNIFDFWRHHKRSGSSGARTEATTGTPGKFDENASPNCPTFRLVCNSRNSFSSPDLTKLHQDGNLSSSSDECCVDLDMTTDRFSVRSSSSFLDSGPVDASIISASVVQETSAVSTSSPPTSPRASTPPNSPPYSDDMNISENILSTYNISCNLSTINLVGANVVVVASSPKTTQLENHSSGYCRMVPIIRSVTVNDSNHHYEQPVQMPVIVPSAPADLTKSITFERGNDIVDNLQLLSMCSTTPPESRHSGSSTENIEPMSSLMPKAKEAIYANIYANDTPLAQHNAQTSRKRNKIKSQPLWSGNPSNSLSNDEKYPSYYPNTSPTSTPDAPSKKSPKTILVRSHHHRTPRTENVYIATPHTKSTRKSPPIVASNKVQTKSRYRGTQPTTATPTVSPSVGAIRNISILIEPDRNERHINGISSSSTSSRSSNSLVVLNELANDRGGDDAVVATPSRLYRKYATLARMSPASRRIDIVDDSLTGIVANTPLKSGAVNDVDVNGITTTAAGMGASLKRFRSLPRFRRIDFSPLKTRINNVLQRYNSDNF